MKKSAGQRLIEGMNEAIRFAHGETTGARVSEIHIPDATEIRRKLGLTQQEFAQRFGVSLGTLRNWEQGSRLPEGPARVLLTIIEKEPEAVRRALAASVRPRRSVTKRPKKRA